MLVLSTQAAVFAATCYVVAPEPGGPCLILDPGVGVTGAVGTLVGRHSLRPVAVAATHGHPDHLWDAAEICDRWSVPFLLHAADLDRLDDPAAHLGPGMSEGFRAFARTPWRRPEQAHALPEGELAVGDAFALALLEAPGHTPGSTVLVAPAAPGEASILPPPLPGLPRTPATAVAFTGDVLFAGSIGRMDLPGGDEATMVRTLGELTRRIPAGAWILPGHGPASTLEAERAHNPYLGTRWSAPGLD